MPYSKLPNDYEITLDEWVVSLLVTGNILGNHAKIMIEGLRNDPEWLSDRGRNPEGSIIYVAEFHIYERSNREPSENSSGSLYNEDGTLKYPFLHNTKGKAVLVMDESSCYKREDGKYNKVRYRSEVLPRDNVMKMITNIKEEYHTYDERGNYRNYQYAGIDRYFASNKGHSCITWCKEKFLIAGVNLGRLPFESTKTIPSSYVGYGRWLGNGIWFLTLGITCMSVFIGLKSSKNSHKVCAAVTGSFGLFSLYQSTGQATTTYKDGDNQQALQGMSNS